MSPADLVSWRQWKIWVSASVDVLLIYVAGLIRYNLPTPSSSLTKPIRDVAPSNQQVSERRTNEKLYRFNDKGRVLKRSLRPDEYQLFSDGAPCIPLLVVERLKNEAACMKFVGENTDIPVPKLLDAYEKDGSYYLWMEFIDGVEMSDLTKEQQALVFPQVQSIVATLQSLRSKHSGGPTGLVIPPSIVYFYHFSEWEQRPSPKEEFVFCHSDLSQSNIMVHPKTLQILAVVDWEYGGFFPPEHEIPFYESSESSGIQVKSDKFKPAVDKIVEFWRQSQVPGSYESVPTFR